MLSNNLSTLVANGHKVAVGGSVARGTLAFNAEQLKKAEGEAERWHKLYGKLHEKRDQEDAPLPKVCTPAGGAHFAHSAQQSVCSVEWGR
jgi:hypothetical protein